MKNFVIYKPSNNEIVSSGYCEDIDFDFQFIPDCITIEGIGNYFTHYVKDGVITEYTESQKTEKSKIGNPFKAWDNESMSWVDTRSTQQINEHMAAYVRNRRNTLLQESDWTDTASAPTRLGSALYDQWQAYRQALRDITAQSGYPLDVIWPTPPQ